MSWYSRFKEERILVHQGKDREKDISHNKFWAAWYDENTGTVHVRWGRLGTKGQTQKKSFSDQWSACRFIDSKYSEKARKGYRDTDQSGVKIDQARFDLLCTEAAVVGTANKCDSLDWVELQDTGDFNKIEEERLYDPDCNPGLLVKFTTRKEYDDRNVFKFLFTSDGAYDVRDSNRASENQLINGSHPLSKMSSKVQEAIGQRFGG